MTRFLPRRLWLSLLFILALMASAVVVQTASGTDPWAPAAPIDFFTASILWLLSFSALQIANLRWSQPKKMAFWLMACAGLAVHAIDEMMEFHEITRHVVGDDDHIKVVTWLAAGAALFALSKVEQLPSIAKWGLVIGYFFHCMYMLVEAGDGDYFLLPMPMEVIRTSEEYFELITLACYWYAFVDLQQTLAGQDTV